MKTIVFAVVAASVVAFPATASAAGCEALAGTDQASGLTFGKDAQMTTAIGAIGGALIGGFYAQNFGDGDAKKGAIIGGALGGGAGLLIGQTADKRRAAFTSESAYLDCETQTAATVIQQRDAEITAARAQLTASQTQVADLKMRVAQKTASRDELKNTREGLKKQIAGYDQQIANCKREIDYFAEVEKKSVAADGSTGLNEKRQALATQRAALEVRFNDLNGIKQDTQVAMNSLPNRV